MDDLLSPTPVVLEIHASEAALDRCVAPEHATVIRARPRRAFVIATGDAAWVADFVYAVESGDPGSLVVDVSAAWSVVTIAGEARDRVWGRLSSKPLEPDGHPWVGSVAGLQALLVPGSNRVTILVPACSSHHLDRELALERALEESEPEVRV